MDVSYRTLVRTQSAYFMTSFFSFLVSFTLFFFFATFLCVCVSSLSAIRRNVGFRWCQNAAHWHRSLTFCFFFSFPRRLARWCRYLLYLVWPSEKKTPPLTPWRWLHNGLGVNYFFLSLHYANARCYIFFGSFRLNGFGLFGVVHLFTSRPLWSHMLSFAAHCFHTQKIMA